MLTIKRVLGAVSLLAALTWGGMFGWAINRPETRTRSEVRTAAFVLMIAAGSLYPIKRRKGSDEEETL